MRTTFVNTISQASILKENVRQFSRFFNPLGKIQQTENVVLNLEENVMKLQDKNQMLERQKSEVLEIENSINEISSYQSIRSSVGNQFNITDAIVIKREDLIPITIKSINFYGLNSKFERIEFPEETNLVDSKINYIYENKDCKHTEIVIQLSEGEYSQSMVINYPFEKILKLKYKSDNTDYANALSGENGAFILQYFESVLGKQTGLHIFWPFLSGIKSNMYSIVLENYKIGDKPYINTQIAPYKDIETNDSVTVRWQSDTLVSSLQFFPFNSEDASILFSGFLEIQQALYPIELPAINSSNLLCGELKITKKLNGSTEGYCKYPVDLNELQNTIIFNNLKNKQPIQYLISLDGLNWFPIDNLPEGFGYPTVYTDTPKLCYFRVNGLYDRLYINYKIKNNINCAWPLSPDGRLFFDGTGLSIVSPEKVRLEGKAQGGLITDSGQIIAGKIIGALGVK